MQSHVSLCEQSSVRLETHRGEACVEMEQKDFKILALMTGVMWLQTKECQQPSEVGEAGYEFSPLVSGGSVVLMTSGFWPRDTDLGLLALRTVRE